MTVTLSELAAALDYEFAGDPAAPVGAVAFAEEARPGDLAVCRSEREVLETQANVVLTPPKIIKTAKALLYSADPLEQGAVRAAQVLIRLGLLPDYSVPDPYTPCGQWMAGRDCTIGEGTVIGPFCVIGSGVRIGADCVIDPNVWIGPGAELGNRVRVRAGARLGAPAFYHYGDEDVRSFCGVGTVRIADDVEIGCQSVIQRGTFSDTRIGASTKLGDLVEIGHDVHIGCGCRIVSQAGLAGNAVVGDQVLICGQAGVANYVRIGSRAVIMAKTSVTKNVAAGKTVWGPLGRERMEEMRLQVKLRKMIGEKQNGMQ